MSHQRDLEANLNPDMLEKRRLRNILIAHRIDYHPSANLTELRALCNQGIGAQSVFLRHANADVKQPDAGTDNVVTGRPGTRAREQRPCSSTTKRDRVTVDDGGKKEKSIMHRTQDLEIFKGTKFQGVMPGNLKAKQRISSPTSSSKPLAASTNMINSIASDAPNEKHEELPLPQSPSCEYNFGALAAYSQLQRLRDSTHVSQPHIEHNTATMASQARIEELERVIEGQKRVITELETHVSEIMTNAMAAAADKTQLESVIEEQKQSIVELETHVSENMTNAMATAADKAQLESVVEEQKQFIVELETHVSEIKTNAIATAADKAQLESVVEEQKQFIVELEEDKNRLADEINSLHEKLL